MENREKYRRILRLLLTLILLSIYAVSFWYIWMHYYSMGMVMQYYRRGHWLLTALYLYGIYILIRVYGGWKCGYLKTFHLFYAQTLGILITNFFFYILLILLTLHFQDILPLLGMTVFQEIIAALWSIISTRIYLRAYPPRKILMVYNRVASEDFLHKLEDRSDRFEVGGKVSISEGMDRVKDEINGYQGVIIGDMPSGIRNDILKYCYEIGIRTYISPKISDIIIRSAESQHMFDTPLLMSRNTGLTAEFQILKRAFDILVSAILIVLSAPVMLLVALAIRAEDHGPVIYRQKRLTRGGKCFEILKFRSMRENAEQDGVAKLASQEDERITKVGRIIRACRVDELPQLFNILMGDMSLVGPRPERPEIAKQYEQQIPEFAYRLKVKAGLTGYAQVYGKYNTTAYDKLKLDLMYIQNCGFMMDLEILVKTVQILFIKESTEGVKKNQDIAI